MQRQAQLEALHRASPIWDQRREFGDELDGMDRVIRDLRMRALDIRTTPVRRLLERLPRVASELAHSLGKRVEVDLVDENVEIDRAVLDRLGRPAGGRNRANNHGAPLGVGIEENPILERAVKSERRLAGAAYHAASCFRLFHAVETVAVFGAALPH